VRVTRIGVGIPVGADLEYADEVTMMKAMEAAESYKAGDARRFACEGRPEAPNLRKRRIRARDTRSTAKIGYATGKAY